MWEATTDEKCPFWAASAGDFCASRHEVEVSRVRRTKEHHDLGNLHPRLSLLNLVYASLKAKRGDVEVDLRRITALQENLCHLWVKV